ncbi:hypothetical protein FZC66_04665 [Priestia megaterium]|nr:hypothetical protein FZC66_04665 [Priestia megaterium]
MEFTLQSYDGAIPCEVTVDDENGRYMLRQADTSGKVFNTAAELTQWIKQNWHANQFINPSEFINMVKQLENN